MGVVINTYCDDWYHRTVVGVIGSYATYKYGSHDCNGHIGNNGKKAQDLLSFVGIPIAKLFIYLRESGREINRLECECTPFIARTIINNYLPSTLSVQMSLAYDNRFKWTSQ